MDASFFDEDYAQMNFDEKLGYLYGLIFAFKSEVIEILNDPTEPNNAKFLYCFVMSSGLAHTFECVQRIIEMRQQFI